VNGTPTAQQVSDAANFRGQPNRINRAHNLAASEGLPLLRLTERRARRVFDSTSRAAILTALSRAFLTLDSTLRYSTEWLYNPTVG
jgi:hypothetical protein